MHQNTPSPPASSAAERRRRVLLPLLALNEVVVFPDSLVPIAVTSERSLAVIDSLTELGAAEVVIATTTRELGDDEAPDAEAVHSHGTLCAIHRLIRIPDGGVRILVQGVERVRIDSWAADEHGVPLVEATLLPDTAATQTQELEALTLQVLHTYSETVERAAYLPDELKVIAANVESPSELGHLVASSLRIETADRQKVLATRHLVRRLKLVLSIVSRELELVQLGERIHGEVAKEMDGAQREWYLRRQLDAIRAELGDRDDALDELRERLTKAHLTVAAREAADRELERLERIPEHAAEHGVIRSYLEWLADLPWSIDDVPEIDLAAASAVLDEDHAGLEQVKDRILDHLAVAKLRAAKGGGAVLCLVGPPGVGKTSLGASIARAMGRPYARLSMGGVRDEAEIRGHRRTYVGAMPGSVIRAIRDAGSRSAVLVVDEIDKLGSDWRGDPSSAMLEVLDPAQNDSFRDHFLDVPFDLSDVVFICTANRSDTIPPALRDRMEIIQVDGYTEQEKVAIAAQHLLPRVCREHGLRRRDLVLGRQTLLAIIDEWTAEAGVRQLERMLARIARHVARKRVELELVERVSIDELPDILGRRARPHAATLQAPRIGVALGLAVTGIGGEVLPVECAAVPGTGPLVSTGQLGAVMEESAQIALSWLRSSHTPMADAVVERMRTDAFHLHVPAGAVPKDGPSAGIAMMSAIASCATSTAPVGGIAMTGELTLSGDVLPVGGVRGKLLAADRMGLHIVIIPEANEEDLDDVPREVLDRLTIHLVDHADQALELLFP